MNRCALINIPLVLGLIASPCYGQSVEINYDQDVPVVDYRALSEIAPIVSAEIRHCDGGSRSCDSSMPQAVPLEPREIRVDEQGLSLLTFYKEVSCGGNIFCASRAASHGETRASWSQHVVRLHRPSQSLRAAAMRYRPAYSFHEDEKFFPIAPEVISNLPMSAVESIALVHNGGRTVPLPPSALDLKDGTVGEWMAKNGHRENQITIKESAARELRGNKDDFTVGWFVEVDDEENPTTAWVTYASFYGFDDKRTENLERPGTFQQGNVDLGDHALDRESVIVKLVRAGGQWTPDSVTYTGHLPGQPTQFVGCPGDPVLGIPPGIPSSEVSWRGGQTTLEFRNASRVGNHTVVYVARDSHAHYPAAGEYVVTTDSAGLFNLREPAGSRFTNDALSNYNLVEIDLSDARYRFLTFSGNTIPAPPVGGAPGSFPPFDGKFPPSSYIGDPETVGDPSVVRETDFNSCVEDPNGRCQACMFDPADEPSDGEESSPQEGDNPDIVVDEMLGDGPSVPASERAPAAVGEPHIYTLDGLAFDFQAVGEFVFAQSSLGGFEIQGRTSPYHGASLQVSMNTAFGFRVAEAEVSLVRQTSGEIEVRIDDVAYEDRGPRELAGGGLLEIGSNSWLLSWPDGASAEVVSRGPFLDLYVGLPERYRNTMSGVLGNYDGDPKNDLVTAAGQDLGMSPMPEQLYGMYADGWRISEKNALFHRKDDTDSTEDYTDQTFPQLSLGVSGLNEEAVAFAEQACREVTNDAIFDQCVFDVGATGDLTFVDSARVAEARLNTPIVRVESSSEVMPPMPFRIDIEGTFSGVATVPFEPEAENEVNIPVSLTIQRNPDNWLTGEFEYPTLGCSGSLVFIFYNGTEAVGAQESFSEPGACEQGLLVVIGIPAQFLGVPDPNADPNVVQVNWIRDGSNPIFRAARLTRQ